MTARTARQGRKATRTTKAPGTMKPARRRTGQGNPHYGTAYVRETRILNWNERGIEAPLVLSAGPGLDKSRVVVSLGKSLLSSSNQTMFNLELAGDSAVQGALKFRAALSLGQMCSFEEAVRAVFAVARERGILPDLTLGRV